MKTENAMRGPKSTRIFRTKNPKRRKKKGM